MYFLYHTLIFVVLNYKVLANFSSGYPVTITRDFPVHNTFCWVFPIRDASLTCPGVTVLFKKIGGNLKNFAIQLGDLGGRGEEFLKVAQSPPSNFVCVLLSMLGGGTATISILNRECVLMSIFGGGATISIFNCVCVLMSMLGGGTAIQQQSPSSTVCVLMSMLISTLKHVLMSMLGSGIATIFILTRECVHMSMIGGGIATSYLEL